MPLVPRVSALMKALFPCSSLTAELWGAAITAKAKGASLRGFAGAAAGRQGGSASAGPGFGEVGDAQLGWQGTGGLCSAQLFVFYQPQPGRP